MSEYTIYLFGCDDETAIHTSLTPIEHDKLAEIALASSKASKYNCQPVLVIEGQDGIKVGGREYE